jgi:alanyl-tRNA synthetase
LMTSRRLYHDDSFQKSFEAHVLTCEPDSAAPSSEARATQESPLWKVTLDATAFYPTSGGQPHDTGTLGSARVVDVRDEDDTVIHILDRPVPTGSATGAIDWDRRFDHMQQHTGQHLLSAVLQEQFGLPTVSFHLGAELSTIDLRGAEPTASLLEAVERAVSDIVFEDRPVSIHYGTAGELAARGVRKEVQRTGTLRAIEIAGIDFQPCGGTHVRSTGQIGTIFLRRCTKIRQDWRLEFVSGRRALRVTRADYQRLLDVAVGLKCAVEDVPASARRAIAERDASFKSLRTASERLAEVEAQLTLQSTPAGPDGTRVIARVLEGVEPVYLGHFATQLAKHENVIALLIRRECGHMAFAQHPALGRDMNALLKDVLAVVGGKGGGNRDFARGGLADPSRAEEAVREALKQLQR